jgi:hypothetical protein
MAMHMLDNWKWKILTTGDQEHWRSLIEAIPRRDVFFTPEYLVPFERLSGEAIRLFFFGDEANYIIYPFFVRRINDLPFYQAGPLDDNREYFDTVSPYGYSGPLARVSDQACQQGLWQGYLASFHKYCEDVGIVCEFARLNPFVGNQEYLQELTDGVQIGNQVTYLDLTQSDETLWRGFNRGNRSNINKARRAGVKVDRSKDDDHLRCFHELYVATMQRNRAADWYYFPPDFFADCYALLRGKISLFCASYQGKIIAAALFLHDGDVVHYFLGASDSEYLAVRPNNLLMYEAICWAKRQGYRRFNLGGGYAPDDSLARFKAAFSKLSVTFYTYRMLHIPSIYQELCQRYVDYRLRRGEQCEGTDYFPKYRANGAR